MKIHEIISEQIIDEMQFCAQGPNGYQCSQCKDKCQGHTAGFQYAKKHNISQAIMPPNNSQSFYNGTEFGAHHVVKGYRAAPSYKANKDDIANKRTTTSRPGFAKYAGPQRYKDFKYTTDYSKQQPPAE